MFRQQQGFNLIELIVSLAVLTILLSTGLPSLAKLSADKQLTATSNQLLGDTTFARMAALSSSKQIVLCPSSDQQSCNNSGDWHSGRLIFEDPNQNRIRDTGEAILRVAQAMPSGIAATSGRSRKLLRYQASGFSPGTNMTIRLCHTAHPEGRKLVVSNPGRARIERINCPSD